MSRFTVERLIGYPLAKAQRRQQKAALGAVVEHTRKTALEATESRHHAELAAAQIECWADVLASVKTPLEAATVLAAKQGRLSPVIATETPRKAAEALFAGVRP